VRANAWAAGGLIPPARRGARAAGLVAIQDFYGTFCALAGVDPFDARAAAAGLPPVESFNLWPLLSGANGTSPRAELALGSAGLAAPWTAGAPAVQGLIQPPWKLLVGELGQNIWQSAQYPNETTAWPDTPFACGGGGCLFNIEEDPGEHVDLAAARPDVAARMRARMAQLTRAAYSPERGADDGAACKAAFGRWGGFWGPFEP
jgi:arylsulfatase I/J